MTDDQTRQIETPPQAAPPAAPAPTTEASAPGAMAGTTPETASPPPTAPAPTVPTATSPGASNRTRWIVGLGVAGLAVAIGIGAFLLLGSRPTPEALKYIPGDVAAVAEVCMDLPGDQMQKLGNLLANFPGFLDQATLPDKLDEALTRVLSNVSSGEVDYRVDIKPWLNGPAFIGIRSAPSGQDAEGPEHALVSATTNGAVTCASALEGRPITHETYRGLELSIAATDDLACVVDGRQALLGDTQSVKAGLDAKADGSGVDRVERYRAARAALAGDQLATLYLDGTVVRGMVPDGGELPFPSIPGLGDLAANIPDWTITGVRAEDDALVVDTVTAPLPSATGGASLLPLPPAHDSVLAGLLPANTVFFVENQATGVALQNLLAQLRSVPELDAPLGMLEGMGGAGELVGWVEDAGIAVINGPTTPTVGVLLVASDVEAAASRVASIRGLLAFAGLGEGIEVTETTVAGVPVTTVRISDVGSLIPPEELPGGVPPDAVSEISFSLAAKGRVIYLGIGDQVMNALLSVEQGASLAAQAVYQQSTARALDGSRTSAYVDVRSIVDLAESLMPQDVRQPWEADVRPYVAPIRAVSFSMSSDASSARSRLVISVGQP